MKFSSNLKQKQSGQVLVLAIVVVGLVLANTLLFIGGSQIFFQNSHYSLVSEQALHLAEAGVDKAIASLNETGGSYTGTGDGEILLGPGSFSVTISSPNINIKVIEATGYVPSKANSKAKRTIKINASKGIGASFNYGIQVGEGGLSMSENSVVNGSVYANGNISLGNNARITGDIYVAGGTFPVPDQENECTDPGCSDFIFGKNIGGEERLDVAQSFKLDTSSVVNKVALKLKKFNSPADMMVRILGDRDGKPDKNNVLGTGTLAASLVTSSYGFIEAAFSSPPSLTSDTVYWLVVDTSSNNSNYWAWSTDSLSGYTRGFPFWSSNWQTGNPTWTAINGDLDFRIYIGGISTSVIGDNGVNIGGNAHANILKKLTIGGGAYYQGSENITAVSYHPGSPDPAVIPMPLSEGNIRQWKRLAEEARPPLEGDINNCPSTLSAGKYIGSISLPSGCTVTVESPIWITGNLSLNNNNTIKLNPSYEGFSGVLMVDNFITMSNGNRILGSGVAGSYLILLSDFNSRDDPSERTAINIANQDNSGIVYSNLGIIKISNNNNLTEVSAWKLDLDNNVTITYDQGLSGSFFSSGPTGAYALVKGTYQLK